MIERRYQSARELLTDLRELQREMERRCGGRDRGAHPVDGSLLAERMTKYDAALAVLRTAASFMQISRRSGR
jgi:hypothetical protein